MNLFRLVFLIPVFFLAACSTKDNSEPPAELTEIESPEYVKLLWSKDSGKGSVNKFIDMKPFILGNKIYTIDTTGLLSRWDSSSSVTDWFFESGLLAASGLTGDVSSLVAT